MTKKMLLEFLSQYEDTDEIDEYELNQFYQDVVEERQRKIEKIEERQHMSNYYVPLDIIEMYRRESIRRLMG